jgi:altronate dehydratase
VKINEDLTVKVNRKIPFGHKFALKDIKEGEYVYKYGEIIGKASVDIKKGDWIHTKNLKSAYMEVVRNG